MALEEMEEGEEIGEGPLMPSSSADAAMAVTQDYDTKDTGPYIHFRGRVEVIAMALALPGDGVGAAFLAEAESLLRDVSAAITRHAEQSPWEHAFYHKAFRIAIMELHTRMEKLGSADELAPRGRHWSAARWAAACARAEHPASIVLRDWSELHANLEGRLLAREDGAAANCRAFVRLRSDAPAFCQFDELEPPSLAVDRSWSGWLGSGRFGPVYKGLLAGCGVAIRELPRAGRIQAGHVQDLKSARRELAALHRLRHPNVVALIGAATSLPHEVLVCFELAPCGSLHDFVWERRRLRDAGGSIAIAAAAASASVATTAAAGAAGAATGPCVNAADGSGSSSVVPVAGAAAVVAGSSSVLAASGDPADSTAVGFGSLSGIASSAVGVPTTATAFVQPPDALFTPAEVLPMLRDIAAAMQYLHSRTPPLMHTALNPHNVLVFDSGRTLKIDPSVEGPFRAVLHPNAPPGTVPPPQIIGPDPMKRREEDPSRFVAPERLAAKAKGKRRPMAPCADVFSFGAIAYELMTGQPFVWAPFEPLPAFGKKGAARRATYLQEEMHKHPAPYNAPPLNVVGDVVRAAWRKDLLRRPTFDAICQAMTDFSIISPFPLAPPAPISSYPATVVMPAPQLLPGGVAMAAAATADAAAMPPPLLPLQAPAPAGAPLRVNILSASPLLRQTGSSQDGGMPASSESSAPAWDAGAADTSDKNHGPNSASAEPAAAPPSAGPSSSADRFGFACDDPSPCGGGDGAIGWRDCADGDPRICGLIRQSATDADAVHGLGNAGACQKLLAAVRAELRRDAPDAQILGEGLWALTKLAVGSPVNCARLVDAGACGAAVAALNAHPGSPEVQEHGCCAIRAIASDGDSHCRGRLAAAGAGDAVAAAAEDFGGSHSAVRREAEAALRSLARAAAGLKGSGKPSGGGGATTSSSFSGATTSDSFNGVPTSGSFSGATTSGSFSGATTNNSFSGASTSVSFSGATTSGSFSGATTNGSGSVSGATTSGGAPSVGGEGGAAGWEGLLEASGGGGGGGGGGSEQEASEVSGGEPREADPDAPFNGASGGGSGGEPCADGPDSEEMTNGGTDGGDGHGDAAGLADMGGAEADNGTEPNGGGIVHDAAEEDGSGLGDGGFIVVGEGHAESAGAEERGDGGFDDCGGGDGGSGGIEPEVRGRSAGGRSGHSVSADRSDDGERGSYPNRSGCFDADSYASHSLSQGCSDYAERGGYAKHGGDGGRYSERSDYDERNSNGKRSYAVRSDDGRSLERSARSRGGGGGSSGWDDGDGNGRPMSRSSSRGRSRPNDCGGAVGGGSGRPSGWAAGSNGGGDGGRPYGWVGGGRSTRGGGSGGGSVNGGGGRPNGWAGNNNGGGNGGANRPNGWNGSSSGSGINRPNRGSGGPMGRPNNGGVIGRPYGGGGAMNRPSGGGGMNRPKGGGGGMNRPNGGGASGAIGRPNGGMIARPNNGGMARSSQSVARPSQSMARPSQSMARPSQSMARPSQSMGRSSQSMARPSESMARPNNSGMARSNGGAMNRANGWGGGGAARGGIGVGGRANGWPGANGGARGGGSDGRPNSWGGSGAGAGRPNGGGTNNGNGNWGDEAAAWHAKRIKLENGRY